MNIPKQALVVVGDGEKALFLRNVGTVRKLELEVENVLAHGNPSTHEQGTDKPGRTSARVGTARTSRKGKDGKRHRVGGRSRFGHRNHKFELEGYFGNAERLSSDKTILKRIPNLIPGPPLNLV